MTETTTATKEAKTEENTAVIKSDGNTDALLTLKSADSEHDKTNDDNAHASEPSVTKEPGPEHNSDDNGHPDPAEHIRQTKPWRIHTKIAESPVLWCCLFFLCFVICAVIVFTTRVINFSTEMPFYIRDNKPTESKDAVNAARADSTYLREDEISDFNWQQQVTADVNCKLIYSSINGDTLMQKKYLKLMEEIENKFITTTEYDKHCKRQYGGRATGFNIPYDVVEPFLNRTFPNNITFDFENNPSISYGGIQIKFGNRSNYTCATILSITNLFDNNYFIPQSNIKYSLNPSLTNTVLFMLPSLLLDRTVQLENRNYSEQNVRNVVSYWAGYGRGEPLDNATGQYPKKYYDGQEMPGQFWMSMPDIYDTERLNFLNISIPNLFALSAGLKFAHESPLDTHTSIGLSLVEFGLPLSGYESASDRTEEQNKKISKWCYDNLHEMFLKFKQENEETFQFNWSCTGMSYYYFLDVLMGDGLFIIATFLSVYLLMIYNIGSVWLASCGMLMIFMNFLPALLLYRFISQYAYFGALNILAIFIILSIGADDIFVICDIWAQQRKLAPKEPMDKRLTSTLKHAGKIMATTSLSTMFSFLGNSVSVFPAVYTFGWFAAWLVFVNYCSVVIFYPTVLAVHEKYFYTGHLKRGYCFNKKCGANNKKCCFRDNVKQKDLEKSEPRAIDKFFESKFFPIIYLHRKIILVVTLIVFLVFFGFATQIRPDPNIYNFPDDDNYQQVWSVLSDNFAGSNIFQLSTEIVWGIEGIDRDGTDVTVPSDIGKPIYDESVSFSSAEEQQYIASFCDDLLCLYSENGKNCRYSASTYTDLKISDPLNYGGSNLSVMKCFMTEFREWIETHESNPYPYNISDIEEILIEYNATNAYNAADLENCDWSTFPVEGKDCFEFLFTIIWLNDDYSPGNTNYDYWKKYLYVKDANNNNDVSIKHLSFFSITVLTEATLTDNFGEGIQLYEDWQLFVANWRNNILGEKTSDLYITPPSLKSVLVTTENGIGIFKYYYMQAKIIREAVYGIALSLCMAFIILTLATQNWIIAAYACLTIFCIVVFVIGFTTMNGWNLGIDEAIIYVMVVGMSVDYVVHLSEAYLHSNEHSRKDRAKKMLGIIGGSVLSGAISTLIGIFWLLFATLVNFLKFGSFIFFLSAVSVTLSLISFTAAVSSFGPQGTNGNIILCTKRLIKRCRDWKHSSVKEQTATQIEMN